MSQRAANIPKAFIHMASPHFDLGAGMDASFMQGKQLTCKAQLWLLVQRVPQYSASQRGHFLTHITSIVSAKPGGCPCCNKPCGLRQRGWKSCILPVIYGIGSIRTQAAEQQHKLRFQALCTTRNLAIRNCPLALSQDKS